MRQDTLTIAWKYMCRRQFSTAIKLLEDKAQTYEEHFDYYVELGTACLYIGDIGAASSYFQRARRIKLTDSRLLLGQAAIFLRRGETDRALQYYLEIKENDPQNKTADAAIEFVRTHGDYDTICRWVDTGRIEQFYPPLGVNTDKIWGIAIPAAACILGCLLFFAVFPAKKPYVPSRADLGALELSDEEKKSAKESDLTAQVYQYILSDKEITKIYTQAIQYFQEHRDNASQVEVNRLLNSNATSAIKQKAKVLTSYYETPDFDTIRDVPDFASVNSEPHLYDECWVSWGGKVSNVNVFEDGTYSCDFLIGDEDFRHFEGTALVKFEAVPGIENDRYVKILGQLEIDGGKVIVKGRSVYQSVHK